MSGNIENILKGIEIIRKHGLGSDNLASNSDVLFFGNLSKTDKYEIDHTLIKKIEPELAEYNWCVNSNEYCWEFYL